jgi:hypothetical protein
MPFSVAAERVIFAERESVEFVWHQDSSKVRVAREFHSIHVIHFTLHPLGPEPETHN